MVKINFLKKIHNKTKRKILERRKYKMKIRKMKSNILSHFQNANAKTQVNIFQKGNYIYRINIIENENIIIVYKEDIKSEYFETEIFEII